MQRGILPQPYILPRSGTVDIQDQTLIRSRRD